MDVHGHPWISTDFHGYPWISMDIHGHPQTYMDIHGYPFISVDTHCMIHGVYIAWRGLVMLKYCACYQISAFWNSSLDPADSPDPSDPLDRVPQPPLGTSLPHAPGVRMTCVQNKLPHVICMPNVRVPLNSCSKFPANLEAVFEVLAFLVSIKGLSVVSLQDSAYTSTCPSTLYATCDSSSEIGHLSCTQT
jgi:hypothetical protein